MTPCRPSDPTRRLARCGLVLAALLAARPAATEPSPAAVMVYWTAGDCVYCKVWKTGERHEEFQAEAAKLGVRMVTMAKPSLRSPDSEYRGPEGSTALGLEPPKGLPSFDFVCQGTPGRRLAGLAEWDSFWRSQARQVARRCAAAPKG